MFVIRDDSNKTVSFSSYKERALRRMQKLKPYRKHLLKMVKK